MTVCIKEERHIKITQIYAITALSHRQQGTPDPYVGGGIVEGMAGSPEKRLARLLCTSCLDEGGGKVRESQVAPEKTCCTGHAKSGWRKGRVEAIAGSPKKVTYYIGAS